MLKELLPDIMSCSAAGLVGEGSECLGLDDEISRDHDWGPAFCLWIPDELFHTEIDRIEHAMEALPPSFQGHPSRMRREKRIGRTGPFPLRGFYRRFLGLDHLPVTYSRALRPNTISVHVPTEPSFWIQAANFRKYEKNCSTTIPKMYAAKKLQPAA